MSVLRSALLSSLLVVAVALIAQAGALSAGWIWDDNDYITANRVVQSHDGWLTLWIPGSTPQYYPLVFMGFWIEFGVAGVDPLVLQQEVESAGEDFGVTADLRAAD